PLRGCGRLLGGRSLDGGRAAVAVAVRVRRAYLDATRLALLGLRDAHLEHALVELGHDAVGVDALGQRQRPAEGTGQALHAVPAALLALVVGLALAGDRERVVTDLDAHVVLAEAGEVGPQDEVVL